MSPRQLFDLTLLAALWGGSFLFMRIGAPAFGPVPLIFLRVLIATLVLLPLLGRTGIRTMFAEKAGPLVLVGAFNLALPFCLFAYAALSVTAGFSSLLNATSPLWAALIGWLWFAERISGRQLIGLALALMGVGTLVYGQDLFKPGGSGLAVVAILGATLAYGFSANYAKRHFAGLTPMTISTATQAVAAITLAPLAIHFWPEGPIPVAAWVSVALLGVASTAIANVIYFRLIAMAGPTKAITVTVLTPLFALLWGAIFLGEPLTARTIIGGGVILLGTATALGLLGRRAKTQPA